MSVGFYGHCLEQDLFQTHTRVQSVQQMMLWGKFTLNVTPWKLLEFSQRLRRTYATGLSSDGLCWCTLLWQSYFQLVTNLLGELANSTYCAHALQHHHSEQTGDLSFQAVDWEDLQICLSQEISDFKPCSRIQNIQGTDMKYRHKLIPTDCSSCLWSYNLFFHIMHQPNQNTVVSVLSALHWLKKKTPNF